MYLKDFRRLASFTLTVLAMLAAGCASYSPTSLPVRASIDEAKRMLGPPTGEYPLPNSGRRLEFARGPMGKHTFMLDFDDEGRLVWWEQVLTLAHFAKIEPGMTENELLMRLGHPASYLPIARQKLRVWNYQHFNSECLWFQVSVSDSGRVIDAGESHDPKCDGPNDNARE